MTYRKPPWFAAKVFNPLAMRTGISGTKTLTVTGRRTGKPLKVPVIPVEHDGARYVVSPRGETHWVRNLRAMGGDGQLDGERIHASELPVAERPPVIAVYRDVAGRAVKSHFEALPDPADHPVFRISRT